MTIADTVNTWFAEQIATGPIAQNTEAYNQALAAKDALIVLLDSAPSAASAAKIAADAAALAADESAAQTAA